MIDATGTDEDHAVGGVVGLNIRCKVIALDGKNVLLWAEDCATECLTCATEVINGVSGSTWMGHTLVIDGMEMVKHNLLVLIFDLLLLT
jgi:hypothetical protein